MADALWLVVDLERYILWQQPSWMTQAARHDLLACVGSCAAAEKVVRALSRHALGILQAVPSNKHSLALLRQCHRIQ